jgi:hypothetical protein
LTGRPADGTVSHAVSRTDDDIRGGRHVRKDRVRHGRRGGTHRGGGGRAAGRALAYQTYECEDNGFPREIGVSESSRVMFLGVEQTTPLNGPAVGARLCFEVNNGGSNVVGYDIGLGTFYTLTGTGVTVTVGRCGVPDEMTCSTVLGPTGVVVAAGDVPTAGFASGCVATVGTLCVGSPSVTYGGDPANPTINIWVNGVATPVNITRSCVSIPPTTC